MARKTKAQRVKDLLDDLAGQQDMLVANTIERQGIEYRREEIKARIAKINYEIRDLTKAPKRKPKPAPEKGNI